MHGVNAAICTRTHTRDDIKGALEKYDRRGRLVRDNPLSITRTGIGNGNVSATIHATLSPLSDKNS